MIRQWGYTALGRVYLAFSEHRYDTCVRHTLQPVQYNRQTVTVNALMSEPGVRDPQAHPQRFKGICPCPVFKLCYVLRGFHVKGLI